MANRNAIDSSIPIEIEKGGTNATSMTTTNGINYFDGTSLVTTSAGTISQVLTSNGAGSAPTFQTNTSGTVTSVTGGTNVNTTGTSADPIVNLDSSPSVSGSLTAGTGITITTGDLDVTSGKIDLPTTSSTIGIITINSANILHTYGTDNLFLGGSGNFTLNSTDATDNIGIGKGALDSLSVGDRNIAIGTDALTTGGSGQNNVAIGFEALKTVSYGSNVSIGAWSSRLASLSSGLASIGFQSLYNLTGGSYNVAVGYKSLVNILTGEYNLSIGSESNGTALTSSESSNVLIQNDGTVGDNNTIRIGTQGTGNAQQDKIFVAGIYDTTPGSSTIETTIVDSNGQLGSTDKKIGSYNIIEYSGTNHTLVLADANSFLLMDSTISRTVYVPINTSVDFPIGTRIDITRKGTGTVTIEENVSVSIRAISTYRDISARYGVVILQKVSLNTWHLFGSLS